jgi:hypothetical protein
VISTSRRYFIAAALGAAGAGLIAKAPRPGTLLPGTADITVFDRRFEHARELALRIAGGGFVQPIAGDATELALWFHSRALSRPRMRVQGVTAESVPFCLGQLVPHAQLAIRRIDRDLFAWAIRLPRAAG